MVISIICINIYTDVILRSSAHITILLKITCKKNHDVFVADQFVNSHQPMYAD